ncbi:hypothetical protein BDN72DRAFT_827234 [Pluteus cervinus]|uniref:Uncharacterized protein n=1 Tax=Pluteus cervinus TaxID=181527 RepID=A0ACD3AAU3_9AGAR|nr:hypothetical protein BDN72DRAFT_827234 [Pluteus cervinus]
MPIWYHIGLKEGVRSLNNDKWSTCHRENHRIQTAGQLADYAEQRLPTRHNRRKNCACQPCRNQRRLGCEHPTKCREAALSKLCQLEPKWDPRPHTTLHYPEPVAKRDEEIIFKSDFTTKDLTSAFRVFVKDEEVTNQIFQQEPALADLEVDVVYTDGSCHKNGDADAQAGCGIWYSPSNDRNKALKMKGENQSNNTAEIAAVLAVLNNTPTHREIKIHTDSKYVLDGLTTHLEKWEDKGWIGISNRELLQATAARLRMRTAPTAFIKVKGHSGVEGNEGADQKANEGANKDSFDEIDTEVPSELKVSGAKLSAMTQATLYRGILQTKKLESRRKTEENLELTRYAVQEQTDRLPKNETIWKSIKSKDISRNIRAFMWRTMHDAYKCGKYWENIPNFEERGTCLSCNTTETMDHILTKCQANGQQVIWNLTEQLLTEKGIPWTTPTIGTLLGSTITDFRDEEDRRQPGLNRLYRIVMTESMYLIWKLRCEWKINDDGDPAKAPNHERIRQKWLYTLDQRVKLDSILTNRKIYGKKALSKKSVKTTWKGALENEQDLDENWVGRTGVLVGIRVKRPPGRNR